MKRIAMIVTDVALPGEKGLGRMYYLAELFCKSGYEVELITSRFQHWQKQDRTGESMEAAQKQAACSLTFLPEPGYTKNVQIRRILSRRVLRRGILAHLKENTYDLVYCQIPDNALAAGVGAWAKGAGIPFLVDIEDLWPEAMRMVLDIPLVSDVLFSGFRMDAKKTYRIADGVVGSSDTYRDEPLKYGVRVPKSVTVYVGSDLAAFDEGVREYGQQVEKPEGEFWVTYAGTLGTSYDIATLIWAADILARQGRKELRIMLLGDGPLRGELETLAAELSGNVTFLGYVPHGRMAAYLAKSDVTVNSLVSRAAQSIVSKIGDYLASGRPMVNTGLDPEFRKLVESENFGVNVLPEDPETLARVIAERMDDPQGCLAMGSAARKLAQEEFDRETTYPRIIRLAAELMSAGAAAREGV